MSTPVKATHGVFYTDGGCRPAARGVGGWGVHGYTYIEEPAKVGTGCKSAMPTKNGYVMGESGKPDITIIEYVDGVGCLVPESTNNIAEIVAATRALRTILQLELKEALLFMDSEYVRQGLTQWLDKWITVDWVRADGQPVANVNHWKELLSWKKLLDDKGIILNYRWVKGHSENLGNDLADAWATKGVLAGTNGLNIDTMNFIKAQGYWNVKIQRSRLLDQPNWFFNTHRPETDYITADGFYTYYLGNSHITPRDDDLIGKPIVDATFAVVQLKECDTVLDTIRKTQDTVDLSRNGAIVLGRLDNIFNRDVYTEIQRHDDKFISRDYHNACLFTANGDLLTKELRPALRAYNAVEILNILDNTLSEYLNPIPDTRMVSTDITALLYETVGSGKSSTCRLHSTISSTLRAIEATVGYSGGDAKRYDCSVILTLDHDLPERNTLSAIAELTPKVTVLTWPESLQAFRYAIVIECDAGRGIWAAPYANLHILNV